MTEKEFAKRANEIKSTLLDCVEFYTGQKFECSLWADGVYFYMLDDGGKRIPFAEIRAFMEDDELCFSVGTTGSFGRTSSRADLYRAFGEVLGDRLCPVIALSIDKRKRLEVEALTEELSAAGMIPSNVEGGKEVCNE